MRLPLRRALGVSLVSTLALASACIEIPATNPYDEDAPPNLQAKALVTGFAAYPSIGGEAPEPPEGIVVEALVPGAVEPTKSVVTSARDGGRFELELPAGRYVVRASAGLYAPGVFGPVDVAPGERVDAGTLTLALGAATSSLSGSVTTTGGLSPAGIQLTLKHKTAAGGCGGVEADSTTAADGTFAFASLRPGNYKLIARTEGATVDIVDVEVPADTAVTLPSPLTLQPGAGVIQLEASGVRPATTTQTPSVTVHVLPLPEMTEMQLGLDPTFDPTYGATGWQSFQEQRVFDLVDVQDEHTVFVQLRSSCTTSPLYGARVVYDHEAPELLSVQLAGVEVLATDQDDPVVVVGDNRATVSVALNTLDLSGVARVKLSLASEGGATQIAEVESPSGQAIVRVDASLPDPEGEYPLVITVEDRAGNETLPDKAVRVRVLRDFSPPTTPIPLVDRLTVSGRRALVWLAERACEGESEPQVICEANPHPEGSFLVRGGAFLDFVPAATNPIEVELLDDGSTLIEVQARDAGGNLSPGIARVEVTRIASRELFEAPPTKELGAQRFPRVYTIDPDFFVDPPAPADGFQDGARLFATGGTAFFSLSPRDGVTAPTYYSYLVAQPSDAPDVGLTANLSPLPSAIRKLSLACDFDCLDSHERAAGGLGAGAGALTWLERLSYAAPTRPLRHVLYADADGRHDLRGPEILVFPDDDLDGETATSPFRYDECQASGAVRCAPEPWAWAPYQQHPPSETAFDGRRALTVGAAPRRQRINGPADGVLTVTGPHLVAVVLEPRADAEDYGYPLLSAIAIDVEVDPGEVLYSAFYDEGTGDWDLEYTGSRSLVANIATGSGREVLLSPHSFNSADPIALGVMVPDGVTATFPLVSRPAAGERWLPAGMLDRAVTPGQEASDVPWVGGLSYDREAQVPVVEVLDADRDPAGLGLVAGLSVSDLGDDGLPGPGLVTSLDVANDPGALFALADDTSGLLAREDPAVITLATAGPGAGLEVPSEACTLVLQPKTDVHVRDLRVRGQGELDQLFGSVYERDASSPLGLYRSALVNPGELFRTDFFFESETGQACGNVETLVSSDTGAGTATVAEVSSDTVSVSAPTSDVLFSQTFAGLAVDGDYVVLELSPPLQGLVVPQGAAVRVTMTADPANGDGDLYVRFGAPPTEQDFNCRPYEFGSDELCDLTVPQGVSEVFVAVHAYPGYGNVDYSITVEVTQPFRQIASYPVEPGDVVASTVAVTQGDPDLYVRFDAEPTASSYDCASGTLGDESCVLVAPAGASRVYVGIYEFAVPAEYAVTTSVRRPAIVEVGAAAVEPGQRLTLTLDAPSPVLGAVRFDADPTWTELACTGTAPVVCSLPVPGGVSTAHLGAFATDATTDVTATFEVASVGCTEAVAAGYAGARFSSNGVLRAGRYYLLVVGAPRYVDLLGWPAEAPAVFVGAPAPSGYLDVLGTAGVTRTNSGLVVSSLDAAAPRCRVDIDVVRRLRYERPSVAGDLAAAARIEQLPDGRNLTAVVAARVADASPVVDAAARTVRTLPAGWRVLDTHVEEDRVHWVEVDDSGLRPTVWSVEVEPWPPVGAPCELLSLGGEFAAREAAFSGGRVAIAGAAAGRDVVDVYELAPGAACPTATRVARRGLPAPARALALDGADLFLWHEQVGTGGKLYHHDLRELLPLHPGGNERVAGFDARAGTVVVALLDGADPEAGRTLLVTDGDSGDVDEVRALSKGGVRLHPRLVSGAVAEIVQGTPGAGGVVRPALLLTPLTDPGSAALLASSAELFAGAPTFDPSAPLAWARLALLESDGSLLAALGYDADGTRRLVAWEVPEDPAAFAALAPLLDVPLEGGAEVERLLVSGDLVGATFAGADVSARVFRRADDGASFEEVPIPPRSEERVIGAIGGRLALLRNPGDIFGLKPPPHAALVLRDVAPAASAADAGPADGGLADGGAAPVNEVVAKVPAGLYLHELAYFGPGPGGELHVYDPGATPPALWRVDERTGYAVLADGPHRPLTAGADTLGRTASPRGDEAGLYFLRRLPSGVGLMRYRTP